MDRGANFCQVSRIAPEIRLVPWVTSGTQKWNGASPNFIINAARAMLEVTTLGSLVIDHCPDSIKLIMIAIMSSMDAVDWARKYFVAASVDRGLEFMVRIGIMANIFISRPIQASSQFELSIVVIVPSIRVIRIMLKIRGLISTGRV